MRVEIVQTSTGYWLLILQGEQMLSAIEHSKYYEAFVTAQLLQLHITSIKLRDRSEYLQVS
jgi:hypothetical protein